MAVLLCLCAGEQYSAASMEAVSDDAMFRDKLKHMGKCKSAGLWLCWYFTNKGHFKVVNNILTPSNKKEAV